jgi:hypothetical protein
MPQSDQDEEISGVAKPEIAQGRRSGKQGMLVSSILMRGAVVQTYSILYQPQNRKGRMYGY